MIHQLLNLTRSLIVLDTETTGVDTSNDRIVEIGFQLWNASGLVKDWRSLINPGVPIPPEVTKVHGITDEMMLQCTKCKQPKEEHLLFDTPEMIVPNIDDQCYVFHPVPHFKQLAENLALGFSNCDFAGKNVRFDLRITAAEMARAGVEWSYYGARVIDAERLEQLAVPRSLSHLHKKYAGHEHDGAHGALSDVRASTTVIVGQLQMYPTLARDLDTLHAAQWPGWIDGEGKFRFVNGVPCFGQWGKYAGKPMRHADQGYWDFIINKDFSAEIKAIARAARVGQYPVETVPQRPGEASEMRRGE